MNSKMAELATENLGLNGYTERQYFEVAHVNQIAIQQVL